MRRAELTGAPWRNGGGVTYEIAAFPEGSGFDDFAWRLSMAEVAADGPFSAFPGVDRTLTVLEGDGLALDFSSATVDLAAGSEPFPFPGEAPVTGRLPAGPILDFNVMTRRSLARHAVRHVAGGERAPAQSRAVLSLSERGHVGDFPVGLYDCLVGGPEADFGGVRVGGPALAVIIWPAALAREAEV